MENKVIIGLDEYLDLRDKAQKVDKLNAISVIKNSGDKGEFDPVCNGWTIHRNEIIVSSKNLTEYINDILGVSGYEVRIEFEKGENHE